MFYIVTCYIVLYAIVCMLCSGTYVVIVTVFNYGPNPLADPYAMPLHQLLQQMMPVWRHILLHIIASNKILLLFQSLN